MSTNIIRTGKSTATKGIIILEDTGMIGINVFYNITRMGMTMMGTLEFIMLE